MTTAPSRDPRMNAPVCISHLPPDEQRAAMIRRDQQRRAAYMETHRAPQKPTLAQRLRRAVSL